ncbi:MAG: hypothetical protein K1X53_04230, partial [Candidatus Sumerlaeaceae bacterium]|nr:hypothetical protein [Candidatus Sumerlaeaceae bacterium]
AGAILFAAGVLLGGAKGHAYTQVEVTSGAVIRGTVKWVGPIPAAPDFDVNVDENFCAPTGKIRNDRVEIDPDTRAVKNAVVYLMGIQRGVGMGELTSVTETRTHPNGPTLAVRQCQIVPRIQLIQRGRRIVFRNEDAIMHQLRLSGMDTLNSDISLPVRNGTNDVYFPNSGFFSITSTKQPWISASVVVAAHPYYTVTNDKGEFVLSDVPSGTHSLTVWHCGMEAKPIVKNALVTGYKFGPDIAGSARIRVEPDQVLNLRLGFAARTLVVGGQ